MDYKVLSNDLIAKFNMKWQKAKEPFSKSTLCEIVRGEEMSVCKIPIIYLLWGGGGGGYLDNCNNKNML